MYQVQSADFLIGYSTRPLQRSWNAVKLQHLAWRSRTSCTRVDFISPPTWAKSKKVETTGKGRKRDDTFSPIVIHFWAVKSHRNTRDAAVAGEAILYVAFASTKNNNKSQRQRAFYANEQRATILRIVKLLRGMLQQSVGESGQLWENEPFLYTITLCSKCKLTEQTN